MPREITIDDLMQRQAAMVQKAEQLAQERDVEKLSQLTKQLEADGRELEQLALAFEQQELAKAGPPPRGALEVMLTAEQRQRVHKATGVDLPSVMIADETGVLTRAMPHTTPADIEKLAMAQALSHVANSAADAQMRADVARALDEIEAAGMPETRELLRQLKADPNWLGGLANKK